MKVLIVDNHDSFTYNLVQLVEQAGNCDIEVVKNNIPEYDCDKFDKFLFSPGPGIPSEEAGLMKFILSRYAKTKSILGICLGHQAIAEFYGASLISINKPFHGIKEKINILDDDLVTINNVLKYDLRTRINDFRFSILKYFKNHYSLIDIRYSKNIDYIFNGLPRHINGGLYHSWCVDQNNFPDDLKITAVSENKIIMGISHKTLDVKGLQFHPESIMTEYGKLIIRNWLKNKYLK